MIYYPIALCDNYVSFMWIDNLW